MALPADSPAQPVPSVCFAGGVVAADVESIAAIGLEAWRRNCFWPVTDGEFSAVVAEVWEAFTELLEVVEPASRDLLLADVDFVGFRLLQHLHARLVEARCSAGVRLVVGAGARPFYRPDWDSLGGAYDRIARVGPIGRTLRGTLKGLVFNRGAGVGRRLAAGLGRAQGWALGSHSRTVDEVMAARGLTCAHPYAEAIIAGAQPVAMADLAHLRAPIAGFLAVVNRRLEARGAPPLDEAVVAKTWLRRLAAVGGLYRRALAHARPPATVLFSNQGFALNRIVALALRRQGARIVGLFHGNEVGTIDLSPSAAVQFAACDEFVCLSRPSAALYAASYRRSPLHRLGAVQFSSAETRRYLEWTEAATRPPRRIERVMVIGFPLLPLRYPYRGGQFFPVQLDLALRVVALCRQSGLSVLYKAHPDMRGIGNAFFTAAGAEIVSEPFERSWRLADAFVFPYVSTTAFGVAVCTDRPIVVLDIEGTAWTPEVHAALGGRCTMVPCRYGADGRLGIDDEAMAEALRRPPAAPDLGYVRRFMAPTGTPAPGGVGGR